MKCIKKNGVIKRVQDITAPMLVATGWSYCPKQEYKNFKQGVVKSGGIVEVAAIPEQSKKKVRKTKKVAKKVAEEVATA